MGDAFDGPDRDGRDTTKEYTEEEKERLYNRGDSGTPWSKEEIEKFVEALPEDEYDVDVFNRKSKYFNFSFWKWDFLIRVRRKP